MMSGPDLWTLDAFVGDVKITTDDVVWVYVAENCGYRDFEISTCKGWDQVAKSIRSDFDSRRTAIQEAATHKIQWFGGLFYLKNDCTISEVRANQAQSTATVTIRWCPCFDERTPIPIGSPTVMENISLVWAETASSGFS